MLRIFLLTGVQLGDCVRKNGGDRFSDLYAEDEALPQTPTPPSECNTDEFQSGALVLRCIGGKGEKKMELAEKETAEITIIPEGVVNVNISLKAQSDLDIKLFDMNGTCLVGYLCKYSKKGSHSYSDMNIYFSGDDMGFNLPAVEGIRISPKTTKKTGS